MTPNSLAAQIRSAHKVDFSHPVLVRCSCGQKNIKTYDGWKRHIKAAERRAGVDPAAD